MWFNLLLLIAGFIALVWSADIFLNGAAATAKNLGVPKILIGLTVVSVGTSAPEIFVAVFSALDGTPLLAVGNALGSNITNIGLVLGITAMVMPLTFSKNVRRKELPWLMFATAAAIALLANEYLSALDGILLLTAMTLILLQLVRSHKQATEMAASEAEEDALLAEDIPDLSTLKAALFLVFGLVVLLASAELLVRAATEIAVTLGVSELIIGLTIIAIGTSLPELAATVGSALKGHPDIAIGNVVGSNILNILVVLSVPGLLGGVAIDHTILWRDAGMMVALTVMLALFAYGINANSRALITRFEGFVMLFAWIGYNVILFLQA